MAGKPQLHTRGVTAHKPGFFFFYLFRTTFSRFALSSDTNHFDKYNLIKSNLRYMKMYVCTVVYPKEWRESGKTGGMALHWIKKSTEESKGHKKRKKNWKLSFQFENKVRILRIKSNF